MDQGVDADDNAVENNIERSLAYNIINTISKISFIW